ncbi:hypothetical protein E2562_029742 [Oryza meyeriana var. granulata]|uniref:NAC domain-containing protein n=1 Tax=Oryza meyeriana var. granulata TaxID=110450 RepID=A0A6G1CJ72_9ORYZ|nr:hypothetical protein E2562_029742 [Oryza meyeriana var. granulata]
MAAAADMVGLTLGFKFQPSDEQLVKFFLLPYLQELPVPLGCVVIRDDPRSVPPWKLFVRNGRGDEDDAYFLAPADGEGRQARTCTSGRGRWITQRLEGTRDLLVGGETVVFEKHRLNFHAGEGRCGSTGWVMHEYAVVKPAALGARHRACHIAFTGHGQKRKRVPDGYVDDDGEASTSAAAAPPSSTAMSTCPLLTWPSHAACIQGYHISPDQSIQQHFPVEQNIQQHACYESQYQELNNDEQKFLLPEQIKQEHYYEYDQQNCCVLPDQGNQEQHGYNEQGHFFPGPIDQEVHACDQQPLLLGGAPQPEEPLMSTSQRFPDHEQLLPVGHNGVAIRPQDAASVSNDGGGCGTVQATEPGEDLTEQEVQRAVNGSVLMND